MFENDVFFLIIAAPPVIADETSMTLLSGSVTIGSAACVGSSLVCNVSVSFGTPYNVTWDRDGVPVHFSRHDETSSFSLVVDMPGTYTCIATNDFGSVNASSEVYGNEMCVCVSVCVCVCVCLCACVCVCVCVCFICNN